MEPLQLQRRNLIEMKLPNLFQFNHLTSRKSYESIINVELRQLPFEELAHLVRLTKEWI